MVRPQQCDESPNVINIKIEDPTLRAVEVGHTEGEKPKGLTERRTSVSDNNLTMVPGSLRQDSFPVFSRLYLGVLTSVRRTLE